MVRRQAGATLFAVLAGALGVAFAASWAFTLLVVAGAVQLVLALAIVVTSRRLRECARDAIIAGRSDLRIPVIARERGRLLHPRLRCSLAGRLEALVQVANRWYSLHPYSRPVIDPRVIRAAAPELKAVAVQLRSTTRGAAGVAQVERLLTMGDSPLYGDDVARLRIEVAEIRRALESGEDRPPSVAGDRPAP